jgi:hypothetical protein
MGAVGLVCVVEGRGADHATPLAPVLPTQLSPGGEGRGTVHAVRARTPPAARACHAVRALTPPAACACLEKGIEGENEEDGERPHHTWG